MAQRLIDANKLDLRFEYGVYEDGLLLVPFRDMQRSVDKATTVDAVPVVRCRECKHSYEDISGRYCSRGPCVDCFVPDYFFCSYAERRNT